MANVLCETFCTAQVLWGMRQLGIHVISGSALLQEDVFRVRPRARPRPQLPVQLPPQSDDMDRPSSDRTGPVDWKGDPMIINPGDVYTDTVLVCSGPFCMIKRPVMLEVLYENTRIGTRTLNWC